MRISSFSCAPYSCDSRKLSDSGVQATLSDKRRSVRKEDLGIADFEAEVLTQSDYDLFGASLPVRQWSAGTEGYRYGFNGMERDDETYVKGNALDFGARINDSRLGRWMSVDAMIRKYPDLSSYNYTLNSPILLVDPDGRDPEPTQDLIVKWFSSRVKLINASAVKYGVKPEIIAEVLFRENQNFISADKVWTILYLAKESMAMWWAYAHGDDPDVFERWSSGIAQMQVKLVVRMKHDLSVEEYDSWKAKLLSTEEGKREFDKVLGEAAAIFSDEKESIDLLAKYLSQISKEYPGSTPDDIIEDYARGPHISRSPDKEDSDDLKEDIERYNKFKGVINDQLKKSTTNEEDQSTKH